MNFRKKSVAAISVVLGIALFATSAFADMILGSGYNSLKDDIKTTSKYLSKEADSFTADMSFAFNADGKTYIENFSTVKYDMKNKLFESNNEDKNENSEKGYYYYRDSTKSIYKSTSEDTYYVTTSEDNFSEDEMFHDIFEEEMMPDIEKIIDAGVGSLQDIVQVDEKDDKMEYIGNITETQVPALVNAVGSFVAKYSIMESMTWELDKNKSTFPIATSDIYVKNASGKAVVSKEGILEYVTFDLAFAGEDAAGVEHDYSIEGVLTIKDVNSTVIAEPDLTDKKVETSVSGVSTGYLFDEKYVGTYVNEIIENTDNAFVKTGEKVFEIISVDDNGNITAKYTHTENGEVIASYDMTGKDVKGENTELEFTKYDGTKSKAIIYRTGDVGSNIAMDLYTSSDGYVSEWIEFRRVF